MLHARHATFYLFYTKFPNSYLRDIALHGANYRHRVPDPQTIVIHQSVPFRMRYPGDQAAFFRLLASVLVYIVGGNSSVFFMAKDECNPFYRRVIGCDVCPIPSSPCVSPPPPPFPLFFFLFCFVYYLLRAFLLMVDIPDV